VEPGLCAVQLKFRLQLFMRMLYNCQDRNMLFGIRGHIIGFLRNVIYTSRNLKTNSIFAGLQMDDVRFSNN
jgi:hypothetical protein